MNLTGCFHLCQEKCREDTQDHQHTSLTWSQIREPSFQELGLCGVWGSGRPGARVAIQVFPVPFAWALVLICRAPSFPGMQRRGTLLSQRLSTPRGSREGTGILIRGAAWGWGGATPSLLCLPSACQPLVSIFWGSLIFAFGPRRQLALLSNYCQKERLQIKYSCQQSHYFW